MDVTTATAISLACKFVPWRKVLKRLQGLTWMEWRPGSELHPTHHQKEPTGVKDDTQTF